MITQHLNHNILREIEVNFSVILYTIKYEFVFFLLTIKICDNADIGRKQIGEYLSKALNSNTFHTFFSLSTTLFVTLKKLRIK